MAIQLERKLFPVTVPPPPENEDQLLQWAQDLSRVYNDSLRQIYEKFNSHVDGTHPHPTGWPALRVPRPRYYAASTGTVVTVPGSTAEPSRFVINGEPFEIYTDLTCDLSTGGAGGLDTHPSTAIAADTPYYLYGVKNNSTVAILASASPPSTGPTGYSAWTYIGAVATLETAAEIDPFQASGGIVACDSILSDGSHVTTSTSTTPLAVFSHLPLTAIKAHVRLSVWTSGSVGDQGFITATTTGNTSLTQRCYSASGQRSYAQAILPIITAQTLYGRVGLIAAGTCNAEARIVGWQEDPTVWP